MIGKITVKTRGYYTTTITFVYDFKELISKPSSLFFFSFLYEFKGMLARKIESECCLKFNTNSCEVKVIEITRAIEETEVMEFLSNLNNLDKTKKKGEKMIYEFLDEDMKNSLAFEMSCLTTDGSRDIAQNVPQQGLSLVF